ncbi:MAG: hypothetical protein JRI32_07675 [Deltaproteobacteria bacterium]|nr:hypothetical protein [Deltaproteobacteria bacterium]
MTFFIKPFWQYRKLKNKIVSDLIFYQNSIRTQETDETKKEQIKERIKTSKHHAAELSKCYNENLPLWYKLVLDNRGESPIEASSDLMTLSNITNYEHAEKRMEKIKQHLKIK